MIIKIIAQFQPTHSFLSFYAAMQNKDCLYFIQGKA